MSTVRTTANISEARVELITAALWYRLTKKRAEYGDGRKWSNHLRPFSKFLANKQLGSIHVLLMDILGGGKYSRLGRGFPSLEEMSVTIEDVRIALQQRCDEHSLGVDVHLELFQYNWPHLILDFTAR